MDSCPAATTREAVQTSALSTGFFLFIFYTSAPPPCQQLLQRVRRATPHTRRCWRRRDAEVLYTTRGAYAGSLRGIGGSYSSAEGGEALAVVVLMRGEGRRCA
jgi:hypothetical protein